MTGSVAVTRNGPVRVLSIDNPPVNGLGAAVRRALTEELAKALDDADVEAIVIAGQGKMFCAGADIRELGQEPPPDTPQLPDVIDAVEASTKPVVAAIHGVAAGGGLELALGCHARVASPDARVGLPEVTLGIIPGAGGTQRLPRLIGVEPALDLIVSGKLILAAKAKELGFIDELVNISVSGDVVDAAVAHAKTITTLRRSSEGKLDADEAVFATVKKSIAKKARGFDAPYAAIDAVRAATELPMREGFEKEREIFLGLLNSEQARAQRHVFFAEREVAKVPDVPKDTKTADIQRVGIVGCGTMGGGIAMSFADAGIPVIVLESEEAALDRGLERIRGLYESSVKKGRLAKEDMAARLGRLQGTLEASELSDADIVIEAAFESMDVKTEVFRRLDEICKDDAILATNTSTLDVNEIADATKRPENVIGTHFFSPAHIMKLMENVRGEKTSKETVATVMKLSKQLGKVGVLVGVCDGFVGNRMLTPTGGRRIFSSRKVHCRNRSIARSTSSGFPWDRSRWRISPGSTSAGRSESGKRRRGPKISATPPSRIASARWIVSGKRPAQAGTATSPEAVPRFQIPKSRSSLSTCPPSSGSSGARSTMPRSSSAACIR